MTYAMSWQQVILYVAGIVAFVILVVFGKIDMTTAVGAISILVGHGIGSTAATATPDTGGQEHGGDNTTTH